MTCAYDAFGLTIKRRDPMARKAKVQGEGDYESARRYNSRTRSFMKKAGKSAMKRATGGVDAGALRKAKSKSKGGGQDARDADLLRSLTSRKAKKGGTRARAR
jgi:hypothetical protein